MCLFFLNISIERDERINNLGHIWIFFSWSYSSWWIISVNYIHLNRSYTLYIHVTRKNSRKVIVVFFFLTLRKYNEKRIFFFVWWRNARSIIKFVFLILSINFKMNQMAQKKMTFHFEIQFGSYMKGRRQRKRLTFQFEKKKNCWGCIIIIELLVLHYTSRRVRLWKKNLFCHLPATPPIFHGGSIYIYMTMMSSSGGHHQNILEKKVVSRF